MGHETLVMVGAAAVGAVVVLPLTALWAAWLVRGRGGRQTPAG